MRRDHRAERGRLSARLAGLRPMTSLIDREIIASSGEIVTHRENWVTMYLDLGHAFSFDRGRMTALRGIDLTGRPMWLVRHEKLQQGYHSLAPDPLAATEEATDAWERRRAIRRVWDQVERTATDLLTGRERFDVTREDARRSALCSVGVEQFMQRVGLSGVTRVPGWFAGLLMRTVEPQIGFVIHAAKERVDRRADGAVMA